ncbi:hypothetical protein EDB92DRAFT_255183 [Lactarius akahatsu]|uniref:Uncharacterized protein n=1 Tax=Lactarius akahatsu TaxID=416441 RepID=A0AAD4QFK5_9AGAM|nr:hypothetical protein EDB92DRAFT_255183 [Lactarius akahatsu]
MVNNTELAMGGTIIKPARGASLNAQLIPSDGKPPTDSTRGVAENVNEPVITRSFFFLFFFPSALKRSSRRLKLPPPKTGDQLREILRWWLSPLDQSANHNAAGKARRSGAAEWLIQRGVYEEWKTAVQGKRTMRKHRRNVASMDSIRFILSSRTPGWQGPPSSVLSQCPTVAASAAFIGPREPSEGG